MIMTVKIAEDLKTAYWKDNDSKVLHAEPLNDDNRDYWIRLAAENSNW